MLANNGVNKQNIIFSHDETAVSQRVKGVNYINCTLKEYCAIMNRPLNLKFFGGRIASCKKNKCDTIYEKHKHAKENIYCILTENVKIERTKSTTLDLLSQERKGTK